MSLTLSLAEGIGTIAKLLPLLKSLTGARRREYFETVLKPLDASLQKVHMDYDALFLATIDKFFELQRSGLFVESPNQLAEIKAGFYRARRTEEPLRDTVRRDAQADLLNIAWPAERRLLIVISHYFLRAWPTPETDERIDSEIDRLIRNGGREVWPTPASRLYSAMEHSEDVAELIAMVDAARADSSERWGHVRTHFSKVRAAIIREA